jgi:hypothetical protein
VSTLAKVLTALEAVRRAPPGQIIERLSFADVAAEYFEAHRAELERVELERAARQFWQIKEHCPVLIVANSDSKPTLGSTQYRGGATLVIVGENWRPKAKQ